MRIKAQPWTIVVAAGAFVGLMFASVSTYDFVMHLDRQVHDVHCSFVPGLSGPEVGESGCQVTLVSPYSSVFRATVWGGLPISLPAMAVFAFLLFFAVELLLSGRQRDLRAVGLLAVATAVPAATSLVMGYLSLVVLDAVCKLCMGIYLASATCLAGGIGLLLAARRGGDDEVVAVAKPVHGQGADPAWMGGQPAAAPALTAASATSERYLLAMTLIGIGFVLVPSLVYLMAAPSHERFIGTCGALAAPEDPYEVLVPIDDHVRGVPVIEVLDPLCPACAGFEERLQATELTSQMHRVALLFPLDDQCNWMVDAAIHPGACAVSEAVLCAGEGADEVLRWAFARQQEVRAAAAADPGAAAAMVKAEFPALAGCIGSAQVRSRLNRSLRWAVQNQLPVLTPQLYVGGVKLCDEDVDIGLDFALSRMLQAHRSGTLVAEPSSAAPVAAPEPAEAEPEADPGVAPEAAAPVRAPERPAAPPPAAVDDAPSAAEAVDDAPVDDAPLAPDEALEEPPVEDIPSIEPAEDDEPTPTAPGQEESP